MKTTIATITVAALLAGAGTFAFAQAPAPQGQAPAVQAQERPDARGMSQDDYNRFIDARVAAIKAGLRFTADQERLWQPVETAIRNRASERYARFEQRRNTREQRQSMDFMQRLETRGTMMTENAQRATALATALRPLWNTLSEDQKRIAPRLMRSVMDGGGRGWRERGRDGRDGHHGRGGMMQRGPGSQQAPQPQ